MATGRFAPSPTGRMHLGNVFSALISWLSVRKQGGKWILRIEDLDPQRSRLDYALQIEDDLAWLGLDWDEGGTSDIGCHGPYRQSLRGDIYEKYLSLLEKADSPIPAIAHVRTLWRHRRRMKATDAWCMPVRVVPKDFPENSEMRMHAREQSVPRGFLCRTGRLPLPTVFTGSRA